MPKTRVIATVLYNGRNMVKGKQFVNDRVVGSVLQAAQIYQAREIDELVFLNLTGTPDFEIVEQISREFFSPLTVGGGIRTLDDAKRMIRGGADKVVIGKAATPELITQLADHLGSQAVVYSLDWPNTRSPVIDSRLMRDAGVGEILLQNKERDGMMQGYDLDTIKAVSEAVRVPVIASSGCGTPEHMAQAIDAGAAAVAASSMFLFSDTTPMDCKKYLNERGYRVRMA